MKKKITAAVFIIVVILGLLISGIIIYKIQRNSKLKADVQLVSNLSYQDWGSSISSTGTVKNDYNQEIFLDNSHLVSEIFVEEGQKVSVGDTLMIYDSTIAQIEAETQLIEMQKIDISISSKQKEIEKLQNMNPRASIEIKQVDVTASAAGLAISLVDKNAAAYKGDGTAENPYYLLCTESANIMTDYLNIIAGYDSNGEKVNEPKTVVIEVRENNDTDGEIKLSCKVSGSELTFMDEGNKINIKLLQSVINGNQTENITQPESPVIDEPEPEPMEIYGYTASEINKKIQTLKREINTLTINKRAAELAYNQKIKSLDNMTVYSTVNGTVTTIGDPQKGSADGSALMVVTSSEGLYVTGSLSELIVKDVKIGQYVSAMSWDSGMVFNAKITQISEYPDGENNNPGDGNPNVSYYPFVAFIEEQTGLKNGEMVNLTLDQSFAESVETFYLEKAYLRTEDNESYVFIDDGNGFLIKQTVTTGKTIANYYVEITSGLSMDDLIAFPYGKTAKAGVKVNKVDSIYAPASKI